MVNTKKNTKLISTGLILENRKARYNYNITETFTAGLSLIGSEVKSLRYGDVNITDGYATPNGNSIFINNISIGKRNKLSLYEEKRPRKLLLNKSEIKRLIGLYNKDKITIVPLKLFFTDRGIAKLLIGVGKGKTNTDKREVIKTKEWNKTKARLLKRNSFS